MNDTAPTAAAVPPPPKYTLEERRATLNKGIEKYVRGGFRVESQTDTTAQLVKPKRVSCLWVTIMLILSLLLVGLILLLLYFIWYIVQKDEQVYLQVDENNKLHETKRKA